VQNLTILALAIPEIWSYPPHFIWFAWPNYASFRDDLSSEGWYLLRSTCQRNLKSLSPSTIQCSFWWGE